MAAADVRTARPVPTRGKGRKRALDILFEADLRDTDPLATLAERTDDAAPPVREFTRELVEGVTAHRSEIDGRISAALSPGLGVATAAAGRPIRPADRGVRDRPHRVARRRRGVRGGPVWSRSCPPTTRRRSSTGCSARWWSPRPAEPRWLRRGGRSVTAIGSVPGCCVATRPGRDLAARFQLARSGSWCVADNYRSRLMQPDDAVLLWISGRDRHFVRGIWARGRITAAARHSEDGLQIGLELSLRAEPLATDAELRAAGVTDLEVQRMPQGSNPSWVSRDQLEQILALA